MSNGCIKELEAGEFERIKSHKERIVDEQMKLHDQQPSSTTIVTTNDLQGAWQARFQQRLLNRHIDSARYIQSCTKLFGYRYRCVCFCILLIICAVAVAVKSYRSSDSLLLAGCLVLSILGVIALFNFCLTGRGYTCRGCGDRLWF
jgi:Flp pilus assembly protein TadB